MTDAYRTLHDFSHTSWKRENVKFDMRATKLVGSARVKVTCNPSPVAVSGPAMTINRNLSIFAENLNSSGVASIVPNRILVEN